MNIVFFVHPSFLGSKSMPRFATMLANGMKDRNHSVQVWEPKPTFFSLNFPSPLKKWMGYIDQYIVFPAKVKKQILLMPKDTLFVFADQALGPWVPLVSNRPHVIHCHDFLAQYSALKLIAENPTGASGRAYQAYIRRGYQKGKNFISVSKKTQEDLHHFLPFKPLRSKVVYNGLNTIFYPQDAQSTRIQVSEKTGIDLSTGYLLHVGGNQWYKNRVGVIELYDAWRSTSKKHLPLLLLGASPNNMLLKRYKQSLYKQDIHFITNADDELTSKIYSGAILFLFPSIAEGFGWPIAEAMASGVPVITTETEPMSEVAGDAAFLIPKMPLRAHERIEWTNKAVGLIHKVVNLSDRERKNLIDKGLDNVKRFNLIDALNKIEQIYLEVLTNHGI